MGALRVLTGRGPRGGQIPEPGLGWRVLSQWADVREPLCSQRVWLGGGHGRGPVAPRSRGALATRPLLEASAGMEPLALSSAL